MKSRASNMTNRNDKAKMPKEGDEVAGISFDDTISHYCGSDWLGKLEQITGSITNIDMDKYKTSIRHIRTASNNIKILLTRLTKSPDVKSKSKVMEILSTFVSVSESMKFLSWDKTNEKLEFEGIIYWKLKNKYRKSKGTPINENTATETIVSGYEPQQLVTSEWFKLVKELEREIYHFIEQVFLSQDEESAKFAKTTKERKTLHKNYTYAEFVKETETHPNIVSLYKVFDMEMSTEEVYSTTLEIHKYLSIIINTLFVPMYDVKATIEKKYDKFLASAFKPMIDSKQTTKEIVIDLLTSFMIAKYRALLTGSSKYFLQMLSSELTEGTLSDMDGSRFLEIMDTVNIEQMKGTTNASKFALRAKGLMKRIVEKGDKFDMSIINDVKDLMEDKIEGVDIDLQKMIPADMLEDMKKYDKLLALDEEEEKEEEHEMPAANEDEQ